MTRLLTRLFLPFSAPFFALCLLLGPGCPSKTPAPGPAEKSAASGPGQPGSAADPHLPAKAALPEGDVHDLGGGVTVVYAKNGSIFITGKDQWGNKLDALYESMTYFKNALPVYQRSLALPQAQAMQKLIGSDPGAATPAPPAPAAPAQNAQKPRKKSPTHGHP